MHLPSNKTNNADDFQSNVAGQDPGYPMFAMISESIKHKTLYLTEISSILSHPISKWKLNPCFNKVSELDSYLMPQYGLFVWALDIT